jgi:hypothetical protein
LPLCGSHLDEPRKLTLADLALKFGEVVVLGASHYFLFDLYSDPLSQTGVVDCAAGAVALAGVEEEIVVELCLVQADFAGIFALGGEGLALEDVVVEVGAGAGHGFDGLLAAVEVLGDEVFDASEFDGHAGD